MKKNLLLVILLLLVTFMTGCNKEDKTVTCTIKKIDSTTTITISRVSGKVTIKKYKKNIYFISMTFDVSHSDISGK